MSERVGGVGRAADWAVRVRPRWPVFHTSNPPWVDKAMADALPAVAFAVVAGLLRLVDHVWVSVGAAVAFGVYLVAFFVFPWVVSIGRGFVSGYRGSP